ncbi:MAG: phosphonate ABC transporter, permease protein PhnE [Sphaerochaetaceae bacterium]|nr:phosphonate ABC transporter, permease protein PhnE [Sphaerochaetaceae bacterium]NLO60540.1 phosphonate ABC transporter, permease protein PhnE [Spirochaetales bacterium]MDD2405693.1 phosphonate ABC transporter, permease protein PhnE [Sphaerochaetaceae bacterium]MDD3670721.1 phosphonate ABC transporter, permease protein PhnE [Sphaerochaetaceae bacterium]MDD4260379.1 phosphonate ABC transporter, permease protein PhnE [Sphaerochaetaceae bacterium]
MPIISQDDLNLWMRRDRKVQRKRYLSWLIALIIIGVGFAYISRQTMWEFVSDAPRQIRDFLSRMFPPDVKYFSRIWPALWDTINISIFGTGIAVVISIPLAILAAKNTTVHPIVRGVVLAIIVASRSVNSMIWALIIVQIVGPGMFASIMAIAIRSLGMLSKLMYEAIEEINQEPIEAITATGASRVQVFFYGYVPQLLPTFIGTSVYRWENNIRESTIIGIVGGGGIGLLLNSAINRLAWDQVVSVLIVILITVVGSEWVSATIRKKLV